MNEDKFRRECKEWLEPHGYTIHSTSRGDNSITYVFTRSGDIDAPGISCTKEKLDGFTRTKAILTGGFLKMFIRLQANLSIGHPDIKRHISVMQYYSRVCRNNPPKL